MRYASHFVPGLDGWRGPMRAACRETQRSHRSGVMLAHGSGAAVRAKRPRSRPRRSPRASIFDRRPHPLCNLGRSHVPFERH